MVSTELRNPIGQVKYVLAILLLFAPSLRAETMAANDTTHKTAPTNAVIQGTQVILFENYLGAGTNVSVNPWIGNHQWQPAGDCRFQFSTNAFPTNAVVVTYINILDTDGGHLWTNAVDTWTNKTPIQPLAQGWNLIRCEYYSGLWWFSQEPGLISVARDTGSVTYRSPMTDGPGAAHIFSTDNILSDDDAYVAEFRNGPDPIDWIGALSWNGSFYVTHLYVLDSLAASTVTRLQPGRLRVTAGDGNYFDFDAPARTFRLNVAASDVATLTDTGLSIPSVTLTPITKTARNALTVTSGAMIYQSDNTPGLRCYNGTHWVKFTETNDD